MNTITKLRDILHDNPSRETFWQVCEVVDAHPAPEVKDYASAHVGAWPAEALRGRGLGALGAETEPEIERLREQALRCRADIVRLEGSIEGRLPFWQDPYWHRAMADLGVDEGCDCGKVQCDASCAETVWWHRFGLLHWQLQHRETQANHEWLTAKKYAARNVSHAERLARQEAARLQWEAEREAERVAAADRKAKRDARKARALAKI